MDKKIIFFRHAIPNIKTFDKRKGIKFLGRKDNPSIVLPNKNKILQFKRYLEDFDFFISSPMKRCKETISLLTDNAVMENLLLLEIDYGDADGMYLEEVKDKFSYLLRDWEIGKDAKFPNGENNLDVVRRIKLFIPFLFKSNSKKIAICTHNVFLRCLIGSSLGIPVKDWFKIEIPYFEPIRFILKKNRLIYVGSLSQKKRLLRNVYPKRFYTYFVALIPEKKLFMKVLGIKKEIFDRFGNQKYLKDPPHCTLYVSLTQNLNEIKDIIKKIASKQKLINFIIQDEYQEFKGDKFAGGGTTLGLKFDKSANEKIISLQTFVVELLNPFRDRHIPKRYIPKEQFSNYLENIQKYGFPFVGKTLIPHISFCGFNPPDNSEWFKQLHSPGEFCGNFSFTRLGVFRLYPDDKIKLISSFKLQ